MECHSGSPNQKTGIKPRNPVATSPPIPSRATRLGSAFNGQTMRSRPTPRIGATSPNFVASPPNTAPERATRVAKTAVVYADRTLVRSIFLSLKDTDWIVFDLRQLSHTTQFQ